MTALKNALAVNDGKAVVISIKREWLSKIMAGEKTLEVRKSRPWEISFPFAVFCYETKANGGAGGNHRGLYLRGHRPAELPDGIVSLLCRRRKAVRYGG